MKANTPPDFRLVLFKDITCDFSFVAGSAADPKTYAGTEEVDGVEYPVIKIDISSASHPFSSGFTSTAPIARPSSSMAKGWKSSSPIRSFKKRSAWVRV